MQGCGGRTEGDLERGGPNGREGRFAAAPWMALVSRADARQRFQRLQGVCVTWDSGLRVSRRPKASVGHQVSGRQDQFPGTDSALVDNWGARGGQELKSGGTLLSGGNGSCSFQRWVASLYIPTPPSPMTVCSVPCSLAWPPPLAGSWLSRSA